MSDAAFWLRLNGSWVPLPGVQASVPRPGVRGSSEWSSFGGVVRSQKTRRRTRTWGLSFTYSAPDAVAALAVAAQGDGGDVMLWDESIARANMLDPLVVRGRDEYPVIVCGGIPLRSVSSGGSVTTTEDVELSANVTVNSSGEDWVGVNLSSGSIESLVKVSVPVTSSGAVLTSAELVLSRVSGASGTVTARAASNAWFEIPGTVTTMGWWSAVPGGATRGFAADVGGVWTIPLTGVDAFAGTAMSLRLSSSGGFAEVHDRESWAEQPVLRLVYTLDPAADLTSTTELRAGTYYLTGWTDAGAGAVLGTYDIGAGAVDVLAPSGTGVRRFVSTIVAATDVTATITIPDSTDHLLGGLGLSNLDAGVYCAPERMPVRVAIDDPQATLQAVLSGERSRADFEVQIREVGA